MQTNAQDQWHIFLSLAQAREILLMEAQTHMPAGAAAQRERMVATLDNLLRQALPTDRPERPEGLDGLSDSAWRHALQLQALPTAVSELSPYECLKEVFSARMDLDLTVEILSWIQSTHALPQIPYQVIEHALGATQVFKQRLMANIAISEKLKKLIS